MTLTKRPVVFTCPGKKFGFLSREDAMRAAEDALLGPTGAGRLGESPQRWTTTVGERGRPGDRPDRSWVNYTHLATGDRFVSRDRRTWRSKT